MIGMLRGHVESVDAVSAIVEVGGVGYEVRMPSADLASMHAGQEIKVYTSLNVPGRHHFIRLRHAGLETHVPAIAEGQWHRTESRAIVAVHFASRSTCEGCGGW